MNIRNLWLILLVSCVGASSVFAQGDFFFSFDQGGPNIDQSRNFNVGDSGSLWVYWSTNGPADSDLEVGAFIDVFSTNSGVIEFTAAETFDYDLLVGGEPSGDTRLNGEGLGPANEVTPDFVDELVAFTVTGNGILERNNGSGNILDAGYSASNDGFEWGRIDFTVIGEGETTVISELAEPIPGGVEILEPVFTTTTITANAIPEPTAIGLLGVCLAGVVLSRRH